MRVHRRGFFLQFLQRKASVEASCLFSKRGLHLQERICSYRSWSRLKGDSANLTKNLYNKFFFLYLFIHLSSG